eukprot:195881-Amphidinium_carterae.1
MGLSMDKSGTLELGRQMGLLPGNLGPNKSHLSCVGSWTKGGMFVLQIAFSKAKGAAIQQCGLVGQDSLPGSSMIPADVLSSGFQFDRAFEHECIFFSVNAAVLLTRVRALSQRILSVEKCAPHGRTGLHSVTSTRR